MPLRRRRRPPDETGLDAMAAAVDRDGAGHGRRRHRWPRTPRTGRSTWRWSRSAGHRHLHRRLRAGDPQAAALHGHQHAPRGRRSGPRAEGPLRHRRLYDAVRGGDLADVLDELTPTAPAPTSPRSWTAIWTPQHGLNGDGGLRCHQTVDNRRSADFGSRRLHGSRPCARPTRAGSRPHVVVDAVLDRLAARGDDGVWISRFDAAALHARAAAIEDRWAARGAAAALRGAVRRQGQHRRRRPADHRGLPGVQPTPPPPTPRACACCSTQGAIAVGKTNLDQFATGLNGTRSPVRRPGERLRRRPDLGRVELGQRGRGGGRASSRSRWAPTPPAPGGCPPR